MDLDAIGAADVAADDAHIRLRQREMPQDDLLHHVRRLRGMMDGELAVRGLKSARIERVSGHTPVWRATVKWSSTTASARAKASSTAPTSMLRAKARLSPSAGWIAGA